MKLVRRACVRAPQAFWREGVAAVVAASLMPRWHDSDVNKAFVGLQWQEAVAKPFEAL